MKEALLILFGWVLGLIGPNVIDAIRNRIRSRKIRNALRVELEDVQFRLAASSFSLLQRHGEMSREFLLWIKPIVEDYSGYEPSQGIKQSVSEMLKVSNEDLAAASNYLKPKERVASGVKTIKSEFLETQLSEISKMPIPVQRKVHEFRYQLSILNQDISSVDSRVLMTFTSISPENLERLQTDLDNRFKYIQQRCRLTTDKVGAILADLSS